MDLHRRTACRMSGGLAMVVVFAALLSGCASARLPQCDGPWTDVNAPTEVRRGE